MVLKQVQIKLPMSFEFLRTTEGTVQPSAIGTLAYVERVRSPRGVLHRHFDNKGHHCLRQSAGIFVQQTYFPRKTKDRALAAGTRESDARHKV
jgi:hypothetical protein